jgi:deazaflavin-dependent oxidoreductase (nitroreductase family)
MPLLLLRHVGAKSGQNRISPVAYLRDGGCYVIFGSKAGAPTNPAWYHNLKAEPNVVIEVGSETIDVVAQEVGGEKRDRLFRAQVEQLPQFAEYAEQTERVIPAIVLTPKQG